MEYRKEMSFRRSFRPALLVRLLPAEGTVSRLQMVNSCR